MQAADAPFATEAQLFNCVNNVCSSSFSSSMFLSIDGGSTSAGADYKINTALAQREFNESQEFITGQINIPSDGEKNYLIFPFLSPNTKYHIVVPVLGDVSLEMRFLSDNLNQCSLNDSIELKNLACTSLTDSFGNLIIEITGSNIVGEGYFGTIEVSKIIEDIFTEDIFSFSGTTDTQFLELSNLVRDTDYSIALRTPGSFPSDHTVTLYGSNWNTLNCEVQHSANIDVAICETKTNVDGTIYISVAPPAHGDFGLPLLFELTATPIISTPITQNVIPGISLPAQEMAINISPVKYFDTNNLTPSIYTIALNNITVNNITSDFITLPSIDVFSDEWLTHACVTVDIPDIGSFCIADLTTKTDRRLNIRVLDAIDVSPEQFPSTADLTILPVSAINITNTSLPYTEPGIGSGPIDDLGIYKVSGLTQNVQQEVMVTFDSTFPAANTFYVISGNLDTLLCTGFRGEGNFSSCFTNTPITTDELYIVTDLQGLTSDTSYEIDIFPSSPTF